MIATFFTKRNKFRGSSAVEQSPVEVLFTYYDFKSWQILESTVTGANP